MRKIKPTDAEVLERLIALDGLLNMHERAEKAGVACKLNGARRKLNMGIVDCGTEACLHGSARLSPWFKERDYPQGDWASDIQTCTTLNGFFGELDMEVGGIYCGTVNSTVRERLRSLIKTAGGEKAISRCERNKVRGDRLKLGL